jgi:ethanolamine utilization protein EutN
VEPHPAIRGGALRVVVPLAGGDLVRGDGAAEPLIAWDDLGVGDGQIVAFSEGGEAAQPFRPDDKPVDAYIAALIDRLDIPARPS